MGPRLLAGLAGRYAQLSLDKRTIARSLKAFARALSDGAHLTRAELGTALQRAGVDASSPRLAHLLGHAELAGLICNGGRRGKQATFALLDGRVPGRSPTLARQEAVAELTRRYFRSRGPATLDDFRWWSGLPAAEARAGIEAAALAAEVIEGRTFWMGGTDAPASPAARGIHLLPAFDEYLVGYRNRDAVLEARHGKKHQRRRGHAQPRGGAGRPGDRHLAPHAGAGRGGGGDVPVCAPRPPAAAGPGRGGAAVRGLPGADRRCHGRCRPVKTALDRPGSM